MTAPPLPNVPGHNSAAPSNGLPPKAAEVSKFSSIDPMRLIREYAAVLAVVLVVGLISGVILYFVLKRTRPAYTTSWDLLVTPGIATAYETPSDPSGASALALEQTAAFIKNQTIRLLNDDVIAQMLDRDEVQKTDWYKSFDSDPDKWRAKAKERLQKYDIDASQVRGSTLMRVSLSTRMPGGEPKTILTALITTYLARLQNDTENQSIALRRLFVSERDRAVNTLDSIQNRLHAYIIDHDLPNLQVQVHEASVRYQLLADQYAKLEVGYANARDTYNKMLKDQADNHLYITPEMQYRVENDQAVASRMERIRSLVEQRSVLMQRFGPQHRSVQDVDRTIEATEIEKNNETQRLLKEMQQIRLDDARRESEGLKVQYDSIYPDLESARKGMQDLTLKIQEYEHIADEAKAAVLKRDKSEDLLNEVRIKSDRSDATRVRQFQSEATEPVLTFPPKPYITIPGVTLMFLTLALGVILLKELLDQRIKSPQDFKSLAGTELLSVLPHLAEDPSQPAAVENVVRKDPAGLMAEAFRQTRTALLTRLDRRGYKTVMFTGATPRSGVSAVTGNLALSLAYLGKHVLVLDTTLRRPAQHKLFDCPAGPGLIDVLRGSATLENALVHKTGPDLDVLPAGDNKDLHPELLENPAFRALLTSLESRYDLILIDAPPALLTSDCQVLARLSDAAVFVVRAMNDKRGMVGRMFRQFEGYRTDALGAVLNGARVTAAGYFKENYEQFYRYRQSIPLRPGARRPQVPAA